MTDAPELEPAALEAAAKAIAGSEWDSPEDDERDAWRAAYTADARAAILAYLASARSAPEAGKAVVKELEWQAKAVGKGEFADSPCGRYEVGTVHGAYIAVVRIVRDGQWDDDVIADGLCAKDEAIAAAQADFEQRVLSALASVVPSGAEPAAWMVLRKGNLYLPVLTSKEDAVRYQQYNPEETLQPLYASPVPAEDVTAASPVSNDNVVAVQAAINKSFQSEPWEFGIPRHAVVKALRSIEVLSATELRQYKQANDILISELKEETAHRRASEAEATSLRGKLEEHRRALEPFARENDLPSNLPDETRLTITFAGQQVAHATFGDFRRARALSEREGQE